MLLLQFLFLIISSLVVMGGGVDHTDCAAPELPSLPASLTKPNVFVNAMLSTAMISVLGNVGILIYMFIDAGNKSTASNNALNTMVAFAVGGLLGDVFLHLIPHASAHSHSSHDNTSGLWVLVGIFSFLLFERMVRAFNGGASAHSHSHGGQVDNENKIRPGAWLNLFADVQHNFVDGMAIAAAFQVSNTVGVSTTLGVLVHEIPHEMGDFAVLLNQGFTKRGALLCQFVSSVGAFAGCVFGLAVGGGAHNAKMLSFTAGGFIYVALVDVLPELLQHNTTIVQALREFFAIFCGVAIMVWVGTFEEEHHHHH